MNRPVLAVAVLLTAACTEPALNLGLDIPASYRSSVTAVEVGLLEPTSRSNFNCSQIAFGQVSEEAIRVSLERTWVVVPGQDTPLIDIDRRATKIIVAEGFDFLGQSLVKGCLELGEVMDDAEQILRVQPLSDLEILTGSPLSRGLDDGPEADLAVSLRDPLGQAIPGVGVLWTVMSGGPNPVVQQGLVDSNMTGQASLKVRLPDDPGPFVLEVRARWSRSQPPRISGFLRPPPKTIRLSAPALEFASGRVGPTGEPGVVALLMTETGLRVARIHRNPASEQLEEVLSDPISATHAVLGLLRGSRVDRPIVLTREKWWEVNADGTLDEEDFQRTVSPKETPARVLSFNRCDGGPPEVLVAFKSGKLRIYSEEAGLVFDDFPGRYDSVTAAGCVSDGSSINGSLMAGVPRARRAFVAATDEALMQRLVVEIRPLFFREQDWAAFARGVSFARSVGGGPRLLIGSQLVVNDPVVSQAFLQTNGSEFSLTARATDRAPTPPIRTNAGDIDGDGGLDVVGVVEQVDAEGDRRYGLWSVLGATFGDKRLAGEVPLTQALTKPTTATFVEPELLVIDLDQDGRDDIVVAEGSADDGLQSAQIAVYSMGSGRQNER